MSSDKRVDRVIEDSLSTATSYLVLSQMEALSDAQQRLARAWAAPAQRNQARVGGLISERTTLPWSDQPARVLYWHLMETLTLQDLQILLSHVSYADGTLAGAEQSHLALVLERIRFPPAVFRAGRVVREEIETLLQAYLADACSAAELRKLHLPRNLALEERFALLQRIWLYRVGWSVPEAIERHTRLWIWLTHLDQLLAYAPKDRREVVRALEYLVEETGSYLTLWMGLETEEASIIKEVKAALGPKLMRFLEVDLTASVVESRAARPHEPERKSE